LDPPEGVAITLVGSLATRGGTLLIGDPSLPTWAIPDRAAAGIAGGVGAAVADGCAWAIPACEPTSGAMPEAFKDCGVESSECRPSSAASRLGKPKFARGVIGAGPLALETVTPTLDC
jgi:hypothetical protein